MRRIFHSILVVLLALAAGPVFASGSAFNCHDVRFGMVQWPAVTIKTETAQWMLQQLGYKSTITSGSVPIIEEGMKIGDLDAFLAQWMPSQRGVFRKFGEAGTIDIVGANLKGGKYTLAVPAYVYDAGIKSIKDLDAHKAKFGGKIYGIDPGSGGNTTVMRMIKDNYAGLGDWKLVQSSTAAMMSAVGAHIHHKEWIVFLGWAPHPMNIMYHIRYLSGGTKYWGPNKGQVTVNTLARAGYAWACPNVGQFLENYDWTPKEQSQIMDWNMNHDTKPLAAGKRLIRENPKLLQRWFGRSGNYQTGGVTTADGKHPAAAVIAHALGIAD